MKRTLNHNEVSDTGKKRCDEAESKDEEITALEFFSGVGGLRFGLETAFANTKTKVKVLAAFDINTAANTVYARSFGHNPSTKSVESLSPAAIDALGITRIWLLSPPCQPFTRGGSERDHLDNRSRPLLHLIESMPALKHKPEFFFLENVPNFEKSECRNRLVACLQRLGYTYSEYIVSPLQFGITNDRKRYYLAATKISDSKDIAEPNLSLDLITQWPPNGDTAVSVRPLSHYLQQDLDDVTPFLLPPQYITKHPTFRFDIVRPDSVRSSTITKAYGTKMVTRAGSFLQTKNMHITEPNFKDNASILELGLRFLTPIEIARLHAFPIEIDLTEDEKTNKNKHRLVFPPSITIAQQYKLLGNSLNVKVIAELMRQSFCFK